MSATFVRTNVVHEARGIVDHEGIGVNHRPAEPRRPPPRVQTPAERTRTGEPEGDASTRGEARPGACGLRGRGAPAQVPLAIQERAASGSWLGVAAEGLGVYGPTPAARGPGPAVNLLYKDN